LALRLHTYMGLGSLVSLMVMIEGEVRSERKRSKMSKMNTTIGFDEVAREREVGERRMYGTHDSPWRRMATERCFCSCLYSCLYRCCDLVLEVVMECGYDLDAHRFHNRNGDGLNSKFR
jgi:hypothetical protein